MLSSKSKQGRKIAERGNPVLSQDAVKLLKTQDSGYLRIMLQKTRRALEKLEQGFVLREGQGVEVLGDSEDRKEGQRVVFVNSREEQKQYTPGQRLALRPSNSSEGPENLSRQDAADEAYGDSETVSTTEAPKLRRALEREELAQKEEKLLRKQHKKDQDSRRAKLAALKAREKDLIGAENELELQRAKMSNSVGGVTKAGVKWKVRERKK